MLDTSQKKAVITMLKYFSLYGYGHFDLNVHEIMEIFAIVFNDPSYEKSLKSLYEKLEKQRMG